jgi:phosphoglycolate phosphatase-like HAD superfamily hydrolase
MTTLLLFDLDGTLLSTRGAGLRAMCRAGAELFGPHFDMDGIAPAGGLDPLLFAAAAEQCGIEPSFANHEAFRQAYERTLAAELPAQPRNGNGGNRPADSEGQGPRILPGVADLLETLQGRPELTLGLLTGNYARTGPIKLRAVGIDPTIFRITAFGDEAAERSELVPIALDRCHALHGSRPAVDRVIVIGDTPRDVAAARAHGCRSLAVATGPFSVDQLLEAGADAAVPDLSAPRSLWRLIEPDAG